MRKEDINGFWLYENCPISREGVFPYKGKQIDSDGSMKLDPNRKYMVFRPRSELTKRSTLESFNGIFLTDEHEMLGDGQRDPGTKRIDGTVYNAHVSPSDPGVILATIKVQSKAVKDLIQQGKRQLSCGYYCDYRPEKGEFNGQRYDFVQVDLVGNHLALVKKGRMGEKCAVYDSAGGEVVRGVRSTGMDSADLTEMMVAISKFANYGRKESQVRGKGRKFACDSAIDINQKEVKFMPNDPNYDEMLAKALEGKGVKDKVNIDKIIAFINTLPAPSSNAQETAGKDSDPSVAADPSAPAAPIAPDGSAAPVDGDPAAAPVDAEGKDADDATPPVTPDATEAPVDPAAPAPAPAPAPTPVTKEEFQAAVDAAVAERYAKEDEGRQLAEDIAPKCGNLWKRGMDADDVAEAACEKLGHKDLPKEARIPFVKAMAKESARIGRGSGMDSAFEAPRGKSATLLKYLG